MNPRLLLPPLARIAFAALGILAGSDAAPAEEPVPLIFDTDMGNDIDDAMALAMIHSLKRRGAAELLAVTSTKDHPLSAPFIDAVNTFYGRPDIPVGAVRDGVTPEEGRYLGVADRENPAGEPLFPHDLASGEDAPDAVDLLRKTLAARPDGSVTLVQVGFFTNFARLLRSEADDHSPLDGEALVRKKVKTLVVMGGAFQTIGVDTRHLEYNVKKDIPSAQAIARHWPTPVIWSGYEIGIAAAYPWDSIQRDFDRPSPHIVREGYLAWVKNPPHDRPTWDLTAVLHAVHPERGYFDPTPRGHVSVADDGATEFAPDPEGNDRFLLMSSLQAARVREALVQLVSEPPPQSRHADTP